MRLPWPLYLAWKQLFPTQKKVSFFSLLAVVGVALGVNVMIVVIAFMQGFQDKFRNDIINAQGHGRVVPLQSSFDWREMHQKIEDYSFIDQAMPYLQGQILLQNSQILRLIAGSIIVIFSLQLIGILNIKFLNIEKKFYTKKSNNIFFVFIIGMAFGFGWTPCIGPILGSILALASTEETIYRAIILLSFYSLGLAIPFVLSGYLMQRFLC